MRIFGNCASACRGASQMAAAAWSLRPSRPFGEQAVTSARAELERGAGRRSASVQRESPLFQRNEIMTTTNATILVVADAGDRETITRALSPHQYHIVQAETADHAARQLDQPIDLVICDLCLDGSDCQDLMRQWHVQRPATPFILLTRMDNIAEGVRAMQDGAADYITKPIHADELVIRVAKWLETRRKEERLFELESKFDGGHVEEQHNGSTIDIPAGTSLEDLERVAVERALELHHGNRTHAARTLGISVRTLQRKLKAWRVPVFSLQNHPSSRDFSMPVMQ